MVRNCGFVDQAVNQCEPIIYLSFVLWTVEAVGEVYYKCLKLFSVSTRFMVCRGRSWNC